ncbi:MAG: hypothetical protein EKK48_13360 [Candidatus Melainabacteria bacterium]|jgi:hypothetical protein|nr:MAG: hypothetical protein EKK48_13360 [Candidatus Melainabacteria bacterium]
MPDSSDAAGVQAVDTRREVILTSVQAAQAQQRYEALVAEYEAKRTTPPDPHEYWTYKALWAAAYGADQIRVVD